MFFRQKKKTSADAYHPLFTEFNPLVKIPELSYTVTRYGEEFEVITCALEGTFHEDKIFQHYNIDRYGTHVMTDNLVNIDGWVKVTKGKETVLHAPFTVSNKESDNMRTLRKSIGLHLSNKKLSMSYEDMWLFFSKIQNEYLPIIHDIVRNYPVKRFSA
jgi:hypothetical protein